MSKKGSGDSKEPNQEHFERFAAEQGQAQGQTRTINTKEGLWGALSTAAGVDISSMRRKIKANKEYSQESADTMRKNNPSRNQQTPEHHKSQSERQRDSDRADAKGRLKAAQKTISSQTQKLEARITSGIKKQFGPGMAEIIKEVLKKPEGNLKKSNVVKAIENIPQIANNLKQIEGIEPAADKAIDEIYKITRTKKPKEGVEPDVTALKIALIQEFGVGSKIGGQYNTLLNNAVASKKVAASVRENAQKVFDDPAVEVFPTAKVTEAVKGITPAANLKKGLSAANKEYWKIRNPEQAKVREAIGNSAKSALNAFKKAVMGSAKDAKQAGGPPSAGRAAGQKPEGPGTGIM